MKNESTLKRPQLLLLATLLGCGGELQTDPVAEVQAHLSVPSWCTDANISGTSSTIWAPSSTPFPCKLMSGTQMLNFHDCHMTWHDQFDASCPGTSPPAGCGTEFLLFHRWFTERLRDDFEAQGLSANTNVWYAMPAEVKQAANGWTDALTTAENNIFALANAGTPFTSLDSFGTYVQRQYHDFVHSIIGNTCGVPELDTSHTSHTSTLFFKLHGFIDWHLERFNRANFNRDGRADLFLRNLSTGANSIRLMITPTVGVTLPTTMMPIDSCGWYPGATVDMNFDGWNDIIWHGPGCSRTQVWYMNGATRSSTAELPGVGTGWQLLGGGDFTGDARPDLVWKRTSDGAMQVWKMNGATFVNAFAVSPLMPNAVGVIDFDDNGFSDFLFRVPQANGTPSYQVQHMSGLGTSGSPQNLSGITASPFQSPQSYGRYDSNRYPDIGFLSDAPVPSPKTLNYLFALSNGSSTLTQTTLQSSGTDTYLRGPR